MLCWRSRNCKKFLEDSTALKGSSRLSLLRSTGTAWEHHGVVEVRTVHEDDDRKYNSIFLELNIEYFANRNIEDITLV